MSDADLFHTGVRKDHSVTALLDGDIIAVRSAAIFDSKDGYEEDFLYALVRKTIYEWVKGCNADDYRICMSKGRCFRYDAYLAYKSNRKAPKPRGTEEAKQYLWDNYDCLSHEGLEADDVMGILATEPQDDEIRVIVSTDKDMLQIPAWQFNPDKDRWPHKPDEEACRKFLYYQWTCGDPGDGYPGIPGFGVAKFQKWYSKFCGVKGLYEEHGLDYPYYDSQGECAKILQWEDRPKSFLQSDLPTEDCPF
jgi:DNA polymerase-1